MCVLRYDRDVAEQAVRRLTTVADAELAAEICPAATAVLTGGRARRQRPAAAHDK
jgi:hypothetical protein